MNDALRIQGDHLCELLLGFFVLLHLVVHVTGIAGRCEGRKSLPGLEERPAAGGPLTL